MTKDGSVHGAIARAGETIRDDYLFRVSLKAVIFNAAGHVLVVKENERDWWDIPGGGMEHGESLKEALARELYEEVSLQGDFTFQTILAEDAHYIESHNVYQMRITFLVTPSIAIFAPGEDGEEVQFVDPLLFENSELITERKIFEYSQLAKKV